MKRPSPLALRTLLAAALLGAYFCAWALGEPEGREAAAQWLALVDDGKAAESWDVSGKMLRDAISRDDWTAALQQARGPLGALAARSASGSRRESSMPGVPPGDYLILQYTSSFANRSGLTEVVTLTAENGRWKVAGYFVR